MTTKTKSKAKSAHTETAKDPVAAQQGKSTSDNGVPPKPKGGETRLFQTKSGQREWMTQKEAEKRGYNWFDFEQQ